MRPKDVLVILLIVSAITLVGNWIAVRIDPVKSLPGMLILVAIAFAGWAIGRVIPLKLPSIVYISLVAIVLTTPWTPGSAWIVSQVNNVNFLALCTPVLAYAGISIGKDIDQFAKMSWKFIVVSILVFTGTFMGSAIIAQLMLKATGKI